MATESECCVDELLKRLAHIDQLIANFNEEASDKKPLTDEARVALSEAQNFIDNNKPIIPGYSLKKLVTSLNKLEALTNKPQRSNFQFKFRAGTTKDKNVTNSEGEKDQGEAKVSVSNSSHVKSVTLEQFGFQNQVNRMDLCLKGDVVESKDVSLINLIGCEVKILGLANTIYISELKDTKVTVCLACRAIKIINCTNCQFKFVCQQLRIDSTKCSNFQIFTSARSMLESSKELQFSKLSLDSLSNDLELDEVRKLLARARFDENKNNWNCIDDFDWLSPNVPSKNFSTVEPQ